MVAGKTRVFIEPPLLSRKQSARKMLTAFYKGQLLSSGMRTGKAEEGPSDKAGPSAPDTAQAVEDGTANLAQAREATTAAPSEPPARSPRWANIGIPGRKTPKTDPVHPIKRLCSVSSSHSRL
jgi:hypothetical protein